MELIRKQIDDLRDYAKSRNGDLARIINDAADTIESLSEKLSASWIPCSERMPTEEKKYLVTIDYGDGHPAVETDILLVPKGKTPFWLISDNVTAWEEAPEPYQQVTGKLPLEGADD